MRHRNCDCALGGCHVSAPQSRSREGRPLSPLAAVSFALVVAAIAFGDDGLLPYVLIGLGVSLAVLDALLQYRS